MPNRTNGGANSSVRERLRAEAASLFRSKGYANTTTRELAERVGLQKASLFHYMPSKEAFLFELCMSALTRISEAVNSAIEGREDSLDRLRRAVVAHVISAVEDADIFVTMLTEMRSLEPEHRATVLQERDRHEDQLRGLIEDSQRDGYLRTDLESKWLTVVLLNVSNWSVFWYTPDNEATPKQLGYLVYEVYLRGAIAPS